MAQRDFRRIKRFDYAFAIWCNSTLGLGVLLVAFQPPATRTRRHDHPLRRIPTYPKPPRPLSDEQLATAEDIFEEFREKDLKPAYIADADPNRALLDKRVVCDLLGFGQDTYEAVRRLSAKWSAESSVHGGKHRSRGSRLVICI